MATVKGILTSINEAAQTLVIGSTTYYAVASPVFTLDEVVVAWTNTAYIGQLGEFTYSVIDAKNTVSAAVFHTPMLTRIRGTMKTAIDSMTAATGYYHDWGDSNQPDAVRVDKFPQADVFIYAESENEEGSAAEEYLNNAEAIVFCKAALSEPTENPQIEITDEYDKAVEDLKMLFGIDANKQLGGLVHWIRYSRFEILPGKTGDILRPGDLRVYFKIQYSQSRISPYSVA